MVTIAVFYSIDEANLLKARLEGSGIQAFIPDAFMAQTEGPALFTGGIRVQVEDEAEAEARRVMADPGKAS